MPAPPPSGQSPRRCPRVPPRPPGSGGPRRAPSPAGGPAGLAALAWFAFTRALFPLCPRAEPGREPGGPRGPGGQATASLLSHSEPSPARRGSAAGGHQNVLQPPRNQPSSGLGSPALPQITVRKHRGRSRERHSRDLAGSPGGSRAPAAGGLASFNQPAEEPNILARQGTHCDLTLYILTTHVGRWGSWCLKERCYQGEPLRHSAIMRRQNESTTSVFPLLLRLGQFPTLQLRSLWSVRLGLTHAQGIDLLRCL